MSITRIPVRGLPVRFAGCAVLALLLCTACGEPAPVAEDRPAEVHQSHSEKQGSSVVDLDLNSLPNIDTAYIDRVIAELADDEYLGRLPFGPAEGKTLDFIQGELEGMGLSVQRQAVPLLEIVGTPPATIQMQGPAAKLDWESGEDYVLISDLAEEEVSVTDAPLVFCGYGIVAPEYGHNDYDGIDMKGKIAVVLVNDLGYQTEDSTSFRGNSMTYYGRWTYKYEEAARQGAAGVLIVHETGAAGYPWFVVESSWSGARLTLADASEPIAPLNGWISLEAARELFAASGVEPEQPWFEWALSPDFEPVPLHMSLTTSVHNQLKRDQSYNLIARLPGSEHPDEHVLYMSHWDHIGTGPAVDGDSIYNGALDNASGTALMLAIAKAATQIDQTPDRSLVFASVTAEEQGLWGSAYYAQNPSYPLEHCLGIINMDGVNWLGPANDLTATGLGHSTMDELAEQLAEQQDRYIQPGQEPEKGYFYRSDHFNLVKAGVPALYAQGGYDLKEGGKERAKQLQQDYTATRYHRPADEYLPGQWDLGGVYQDGQLLLGLGWWLANSKYRPVWYEHSEFADQE